MPLPFEDFDAEERADQQPAEPADRIDRTEQFKSLLEDAESIAKTVEGAPLETLEHQEQALAMPEAAEISPPPELAVPELGVADPELPAEQQAAAPTQDIDKQFDDLTKMAVSLDTLVGNAQRGVPKWKQKKAEAADAAAAHQEFLDAPEPPPEPEEEADPFAERMEALQKQADEIKAAADKAAGAGRKRRRPKIADMPAEQVEDLARPENEQKQGAAFKDHLQAQKNANKAIIELLNALTDELLELHLEVDKIRGKLERGTQ